MANNNKRLEDDSLGVKIELREWELNENSTTYDKLVAAPSDATMESQWILFLTILVLSIVLMVFVFISMLRDAKTRRNSFNTYILFLLGPDIFFNVCCTFSCALNVRVGRYFSVDGCVVQSLYCIFAVASSAWINAIVVYQLHQMLWCSRKAIRYHPPSRKQVTTQCLSVYVYAIFMATWSNWVQDDDSWWPIRNNVYSGVFCLPMPYDTDSTLFFYLLYAPLVFLLPLLYICYVVLDMAYHKLLPDPSQRKTLMVFLRLLLVYFVMWVPALGLVFVGSNYLSTWWVAIGGAWAHLQGAVSAAICLFKPDIQKACQKSFRACSCYCGSSSSSSVSTKKANKELSSHHGTEETHPSNLDRKDPVLRDDEVQFHIYKSCELFLGLADDDDSGELLQNGIAARKQSSSSCTVRTDEYETSRGFELAGELQTIPSGELVKGGCEVESV